MDGFGERLKRLRKEHDVTEEVLREWYDSGVYYRETSLNGKVFISLIITLQVLNVNSQSQIFPEKILIDNVN